LSAIFEHASAFLRKASAAFIGLTPHAVTQSG
jgi:hypothetical protein